MNKLALFDIDKTLIHGSSAHQDAFKVCFKKLFNVTGSQDDIKHAGKTDQQILIEVLEVNGVSEEKVRPRIQECINLITDVYKKTATNDKIVILEGVHELLSQMNKKRILLGLVTGNIEAIARDKLAKVKLNHFFKLGGFGSDPHHNRGDLVKLAIKKAQEKFNFKNNKKNVFLFGDAAADMKAGKEGGATAIGITTGVFSEKDLKQAGADYIFPNLKDTAKILKIIC